MNAVEVGYPEIILFWVIIALVGLGLWKIVKLLWAALSLSAAARLASSGGSTLGIVRQLHQPIEFPPLLRRQIPQPSLNQIRQFGLWSEALDFCRVWTCRPYVSSAGGPGRQQCKGAG